MKIKKFPMLIIIILLSAPYIHISAQNNYRSGYIIKERNDTIRGYILYRGKNLSKVCSFKKDLVSDAINYYPSEIMAFRFDNGKYFISKIVKLENETNQYFLEYLIKGKANIYYLRDDIDHYFIEKEGIELVELSEKEKIFENKYGDEYFKQNIYKGKLRAALFDCKDIFTEIDKTQLSHSSLIKLAKDYHNRVCTDEQCIVFEQKIQSLNTTFAFYAGTSFNRISFGKQLNSNFSTGSLIGCRVEFENIFKWTERASLLLDFSLHRLTNFTLTETEYDEITYLGVRHKLSPPSYNDNNYKPNLNVNIKAIALRIPISFNYQFSKSIIRPFIGVGFSNVFFLNQNKEFVLHRFFNVFDKSIPVYNVGLTGRTGSEFILKNNHSIFIEANYEHSQSMNINSFLRFKNNSISILAGYAF